jgi:cytochrome c5
MKASLAGVLVTLAAATACSPAVDHPRAPAPAIAEVHKHQCNRCHTLPQPGQHPRSFVEQALARHHKRVHLTDDEWAQLIDYLAASDGGG